MAEFDDFGLLIQMARRELVHLLESMPEAKELAVEANLMRPLDAIVSMSLLQRHNCVRVQQFTMNDKLQWGEEYFRRVYIMRPTVLTARCISRHIQAEPNRRYSVIFIPNRSYLCEMELERNGVIGLIDVYHLELPLIPIDSHLFSLELTDFTKSTIVDQTLNQLYNVAKSLWQLQTLYGLIPTVYGVGEVSVRTNCLMKKLYADLGEPRSSPDQPVSHIFLLDRNLDLTSVLMTGLTYESMLHDIFGISCGKVSFGGKVEKRIRGRDIEKSRLKIYALNNNDVLFSAVRNMHMTAVFPFLSAKAKTLQASYDKGSRLDQVKEMKEFVSNELLNLRQQHRLLELHICACEEVLENCKGMSDRLALEHALVTGSYDANEVVTFLDDMLCQESNMWQVLLLACLWSVCQDGLSAKHYSAFRTSFLRTYGHEFLPLLHTLSLQGLLAEKITLQSPSVKSLSASWAIQRPTFKNLSKRMNLLPVSEDKSEDFRSPKRMSYVYSGSFTPALCQIIADTIENGWNASEIKKTFGDCVFCDQNSYTASKPPDSRIRKAILAYFIGGVTYAEVAALTLLAQNNNIRIIIAATNVIHREQFIRDMGNF